MGRARRALDGDPIVCDRCLTVCVGVASDGHTPYCHRCMHECTFRASELAEPTTSTPASEPTP